MATEVFRFRLGVVVAVIFWAGSLPSVSTQSLGLIRSGYNETCNKTIKCQSQSWFTCNADTLTCQCAKPEEMMYDASKGKCLALVGERCKFGFEEDGDQNTWYDKAECVPGAFCSPSGICTCPTGTYEDGVQISCHPVKGYGESCDRNVDCNGNKYLSCVEGVCNCDPDAAMYNPTPYTGYYYDGRSGGPKGLDVPGDICVGRVGQSCSNDEMKYCVRNAECKHYVCECLSSYISMSDKLCGLDYQEKCSSGGDQGFVDPKYVCSNQFICSGRTTGNTDNRNAERDSSSKCSCRNPTYQEYDSDTKSCRGRVGSPCDPTQMDSCTLKSSCVEQDGIFQCERDEGYVVTEGRKCQLEFGSGCVYTGNRLKIEETCDEAASLDCIRGRCRCPNEVDVYEEDRRRCSVPVGLACQETSECVTNAVCKENPAGKKFAGRCVCSSGFQMRINRTCEVEGSQEEIHTTLEPEEVEANGKFVGDMFNSESDSFNVLI